MTQRIRTLSVDGASVDIGELRRVVEAAMRPDQSRTREALGLRRGQTEFLRAFTPEVALLLLKALDGALGAIAVVSEEIGQERVQEILDEFAG